MYDLPVHRTKRSRIAERARLGSLLAFLAALLCSPQAPIAAETARESITPPAEQSGATSDAAGSPDAHDETAREYSRQYIGAFVEYSARAGASIATDAPYSGWNLDIGMRHSFPVLLGDFRVAYRYDHLTPTDAAPENLADDVALLGQHSLGGFLAIHPGYLLLLGSDQLSYTLASLHAEIGFGAQYSVFEPSRAALDAGADYRTNIAPFVSLGVGLGIPLLDPDVGHAPWLHLVYRWHVADFDGDIETFDLDMHLLQLGLGWRINGLLF
jgi:hypothetical protein